MIVTKLSSCACCSVRSLTSDFTLSLAFVGDKRCQSLAECCWPMPSSDMGTVMLVPVEALISQRLASVVQVEALPFVQVLAGPCPFQRFSTSSMRFAQPQLLRPPPPLAICRAE
jgi:hypothetical protein